MSEATIHLESGQQDSGPVVRLRVVKGPHRGALWTFNQPTTITIGRSSPSQLKLPDEQALSREHWQLVISPPTANLIDNQSSNGTWVNGVRLIEATLTDGDSFGVGDTEIVFERLRVDDEPSPNEPDTMQLGKSDGLNLSETIDLPPGHQNRDGASSNRGPRDVPSDYETVAPESAPKSVGPYDLLRLIGRGGMATVHHAVHRRTKKEYAVKLIRADRPVGEKQLQLFTREASLLTRLEHPRILKAFEFGIEGNLPFLVTEYIKEINLLSLLTEQSVTRRVETATWTVSRLLQAVHYAHEKGIVHRDIKPGNLLAYRDGHRLQVKLGDFGLAKCFRDAGFSALTSEHSVRGTVAYMAPEQFRNSRDAGPEVDIYSCGACLFRMLTGQVPNIVMKKDQALGVLDETTEIPEELRDIVRRSMHPDPVKRITCTEFAEAIFPFHGRP